MLHFPIVYINLAKDGERRRRMQAQSEAMGLDSAQKCSENAASALVEWRNHVAEMPA